MACIELKNITKCFGNRKAVDDLSLLIKESSFVVLLGASGCGKSTLLRLIAGLELPDEGNVLFKDKDANRLQPHRRDCSLAFQNGICYDHWTVSKNIHESAKGTEASLVSDVIVKLGLEACMHQYPAELSGGERQRVSLARTLVSSKGIFLLDEPLAQLNPKMRYQARELIRRIHDQYSKTTVFVTHELSEALYLADHVVVMDQGMIVSQGSPRECFDPPKNEHCASLLGSYYHLPSSLEFPLPHHWRILAMGDEATSSKPETCKSDAMVLHGKIVSCRWLGTYWEVKFVPVKGSGSANLPVDQPLSVHVTDGPSTARELANQLQGLERGSLREGADASGAFVWMSLMVRSGVKE